MLSLWLLIALFTALAAGLILWPLFHPRKTNNIGETQFEVNIYREQLTQLQQQLKNKEITQTEYDRSELELEKALLAEVPATSPKKLSLAPSRVTAGILILLIGVSAIGLYYWWGNSQQLKQVLATQERQKMAAAAISRYGSVQNITVALQHKLQEDPSNAQGWFLLGKLYLDQQEWVAAAAALEKAGELAPNNPDILEKQAESLFFANNQKLNSQAQKIINRVLQLAPNNVNALNLIAFNAYRQNDYKTAIDTWQKLLSLFPADSNDAQALQAMIAKAQAQMQHTGPQITLKVEVSIAKSLLKKVNPNDIVFIYAKAVKGPPMPLAVQRKQVKDLPITITLTQQDAMMPNLTLADFNQVKVMARISKSGQALTQSGDIETESPIINPTVVAKPIQLIIGE